jgi:hypothetical protein
MLGLDPSISLSAPVAEMLDISGLCAATDARVRPEHDEEAPAASQNENRWFFPETTDLTSRP